MKKAKKARKTHHDEPDEPYDTDESDDAAEEPSMGNPFETEPKDELKHPDPKGKMRSYAPGYGPGPEGEPVELEKPAEEEKKPE